MTPTDKQDSKYITPKHIENLMETDKIVIRYYKGLRLVEKIKFNATDLHDYIEELKKVDK